MHVTTPCPGGTLLKAKATKLLPRTAVDRVHGTHPNLWEPRAKGLRKQKAGELEAQLSLSPRILSHPQSWSRVAPPYLTCAEVSSSSLLDSSSLSSESS